VSFRHILVMRAYVLLSLPVGKNCICPILCLGITPRCVLASEYHPPPCEPPLRGVRPLQRLPKAQINTIIFAE
jgi:hypothetical protein